jgi:hypothetical protein
MRLQDSPNLPSEIPSLIRQLDSLYRNTAQQVNQLSEGQMVANYNADTAAPTAGRFNRGDFIKNSAPSELGGAGSKYVIHGWQCIAAGTPGTWVQCRFLTGN